MLTMKKHAKPLYNRVAARRAERNWSQQELAARSGLSRTEISAIEIGRVVPSAAAALSLANLFGCSVENLFYFSAPEASTPVPWFGGTPAGACRFWTAEINGRAFRVPVEPTHAGVILHHGTWDGAQATTAPDALAEKTLIMAGCDPASALLAAELQQRFGVTLLPLMRSTGDALALLKEGKVHVGGLHAGTKPEANRKLVREKLGKNFLLLRVAQWDEGVALASSVSSKSLNETALRKLSWISRDKGSGARRCMDELLGGTRKQPKGAERVVRDHRSVADAVKNGWADAGVCIRLAAEEAGLGFLLIQQEPYDLCFRADLQDDPRIKALIDCVRSARIRRAIGDLPGYAASDTGELSRATA